MEYIRNHGAWQNGNGGIEWQNCDRGREPGRSSGPRTGGSAAPRKQARRQMDQPAGAGSIPKHHDQGIDGSAERYERFRRPINTEEATSTIMSLLRLGHAVVLCCAV